MSWRFFRSIRLPLGMRLNVRGTGTGWSWGISVFRFGVSGTGQRWVSIGLPGTGFRFYKTFGLGAPSTDQQSLGEHGAFPIDGPPLGAIRDPPSALRRRIGWRNIR